MVIYILINDKRTNKAINAISNRIHKGNYLSKAHSGLYTVIAVSDKGEVGVDIEKKAERSKETIRYFFSKYRSFVIEGEIDESLCSFYKTWTAMESYFKLRKKGFYTDKNFSVDLDRNKLIVGSKEHYIAHIDYNNYIICICTQYEEIRNIQVIDDMSCVIA